VRVVSLVCSNTEIVCALGCADFLVGVDNHSDYPPEVVGRLPRVGPELQVDLSAVADLRPDLVLASLSVPGHEKVVEGLRAAGLPHLVLDPVSLEDVYGDIATIAAALGCPRRGRRLVEQMRAALPQPAESPGGPAVLVEWWPRPVIAAARHSWVSDLLRAAGAAHPLARVEARSTRVTPEQALEMDLQAVVISWCGVPADKYRPEVVLRREGWSQVPAVRRGQVFCISEAFLGRPGPRLVEGWRRLREVVRAC
jgi:iron complex transport system substrate-binding protein